MSNNFERITAEWKVGTVSNFDYLLYLNYTAGRNFNSLSQYPVFPWVVKDFTSPEVSFENPNTFRDLTKSIGAGKKNKDDLERYFAETEGLDKHPYHFSIHYSSPANILHYLIRLEPFTQCHWKLNRGFDNANRMFHDLHLSWTTSGVVDMKELIPEFFYLPEFLQNGNQLELGQRTSGQSIDDVVLPPWAHEDAREFIRVHRQCLESAYVSSQIHGWIDLIFGHSQRGQAAIDAFNVFKPKSYDDQIDFKSLDEADILEIREFGQSPKQLFTKKHPVRVQLNESKHLFFNYYDCLIGHEVVRVDFPIGQISELQDKNKEPYAFTPINAQRVSSAGLMSVVWGLPTGSLRFTQSKTKEEYIFSNLHNGFVTSLDMTADGMTLVTGGSDAVVSIWDLKVSPTEPPSLDLVGFLVGHTAHIEKTIVSDRFRAVVSMDADGIVVVWDLDRLCASFFLHGFEGSLTCIAFDVYSGDFAVCTSTAIYIYTINGRFIASAKMHEAPVTFGVLLSPQDVEGTKMSNMLITGHEDGSLRMWGVAHDSTFNFQLGKLAFEWQLKLRKTLDYQTMHSTAITSIYVPESFDCFFSGDSSGMIVRWEFNMEHVSSKSIANASKDLMLSPDAVKNLSCSVCNRRLKNDSRQWCRACQAVFCWTCKLPHNRTVAHAANHRPQSPTRSLALAKSESSDLVLESTGEPIFPSRKINQDLKEEEINPDPATDEINKAIDTLFE
eukprot:TRINITY_DN45476_c0_g2_i1.p1 TRINITY_DN45476_c0_g2~~TRINITY_DN45476_c0_g2_i1.p1  ORF type:complete len:785 (+),score=161.25 TRINITY_DN45476_c0_g2_i1:180-2357(+)